MQPDRAAKSQNRDRPTSNTEHAHEVIAIPPYVNPPRLGRRPNLGGESVLRGASLVHRPSVRRLELELGRTAEAKRFLYPLAFVRRCSLRAGSLLDYKPVIPDQISIRKEKPIGLMIDR
jgi:hypothetical protein